MRALTFLAPGRMEWREAPMPTLASPDAALVRPIAVGVCDFDRAMVAGVLDVLPPPIVLGHEIAGEVTVALACALGVANIDFSGDDPAQLAQADALGARPAKIGEPLRKGGYALVAAFSLDPKHLAIGVSEPER